MNWTAQLERPDAGFFPAFALQVKAEGETTGVVREAVKVLTPWVDWEGHLPHLPHGLLGLRAVHRLEPLLARGSFLRLLATQLHAFAHDGRRAKPLAVPQGAGSRRNLGSFLAARKPGLAWTEAASLEVPEADDFQGIGGQVAADMANVGHKAVVAHHLGDLHERLGRPKATGRRLLAVTAWLAATAEDRFWHQRAAKRLEGWGELSEGPARLSDAEQDLLVREICDAGLVELLNRLAARIREGLTREDYKHALVRAAAEKLMDARRDLEGKTGWNLVFLATHFTHQPGDARLACQAAALVNLFPTEEASDRLKARGPEGAPTAARLTDAILDVEPAAALGLAEALFDAAGVEPVLKGLAEAAAWNDPAFNHAHHALLVAACADLATELPAGVQRSLLGAAAKSLANSQGSSDLSRMAEKALQLP